MGLPNIGPVELILILAVLLLVVGPRRLPEMGQAIGRTIREFRKASSEITDAPSLTPAAMPPAMPPASSSANSAAAGQTPAAPPPVAAAPAAEVPVLTASVVEATPPTAVTGPARDDDASGPA